jgi:hypothetical protein
VTPVDEFLDMPPPPPSAPCRNDPVPCEPCATLTHESCTNPAETRQDWLSGHQTVVRCCCATEDRALDWEIGFREYLKEL